MLISDSISLASLCRTILHGNFDFVCIDTEFNSNGRVFYYPELCLIQIAYGEKCFAIDTLVEELDYSPLLEIMLSPKIVKIFHGCKLDLLCIKRLIGTIPYPIFDTQIAEMLCNCYEYSVGYSTLVQKYFDIAVDKTSRAINWKSRPLTAESIKYALGDVSYLGGLYKLLTIKIEEQNKYDWLHQELHYLAQKVECTSTYKDSSEEINCINEWRDNLAKKHNVGIDMILSEKEIKLITLMLDRPEHLEELLAQCASKKRLKFYKYSELQKQAFHLKEERKLMTPERSHHNDTKEVDFLNSFISLRCKEMQVSQTLVASKKALKGLILNPNDPDNPLNQGWKKSYFGEHILKIISGRERLTLSFDTNNGWSYAVMPLANDPAT